MLSTPWRAWRAGCTFALPPVEPVVNEYLAPRPLFLLLPEVRQRLRKFGALIRLPGGRRIPPVLLNGYGMVELGAVAMMGDDDPDLT